MSYVLFLNQLPYHSFTNILVIYYDYNFLGVFLFCLLTQIVEVSLTQMALIIVMIR